MPGRLRTGDVLLLAAVLLLAVASAHRIQAAADTRHREAADRAVFTRYVAEFPGHFVRLTVTRVGGVDVACARHRPTVSRPADFRLCAHLRHDTHGPRVVAAYATVLRGGRSGVMHRCGRRALHRAECRPRTGPFARGARA
jgi:hypothetical protein